MQCKTCGEFIYKGKKFNARKEFAHGEDYLGIQVILEVSKIDFPILYRLSAMRFRNNIQNRSAEYRLYV
jgi:RNase P subunit RPR2